MPEVKRSKRSTKRSNERSKRIAEASALALALEEEIATLSVGIEARADTSVMVLPRQGATLL